MATKNSSPLSPRAERAKAYRHLAQSTKLLSDLTESLNTASMAYANAGIDMSTARRNRLRDKAETLSREWLRAVHEAHCDAVEAGIAQPEPERYNQPVYAYTAAGDRLHHGYTRTPANYTPVDPPAPTVYTPLRLELQGWSVECTTVAERDELLAYAQVKGIAIAPCNGMNERFLHIGWYKGLTTFTQPEPTIIPVTDFRALCDASTPTLEKEETGAA